jgi:transcriptional regulator with XRE-family HTH domain
MPPARATTAAAGGVEQADGSPAPEGSTEAHPVDPPEDAQLTARRLGSRIRESRKRKDMTARALAGACEITPGFVSQLENGTVLPSIPTLMRLAAVLGVRPSDLLAPDAPSTQLVAVPDRRVYDYPDRRFREAIISSDELNLFEIAWCVVEPNGGTGPELFTHGSTTEAVICTGGEIDIHVGDETFVLGVGDCLTFSGSSVHGCTNRGKVPAETYWITAPAVY